MFTPNEKKMQVCVYTGAYEKKKIPCSREVQIGVSVVLTRDIFSRQHFLLVFTFFVTKKPPSSRHDAYLCVTYRTTFCLKCTKYPLWNTQ